MPILGAKGDTEALKRAIAQAKEIGMRETSFSIGLGDARDEAAKHGQSGTLAMLLEASKKQGFIEAYDLAWNLTTAVASNRPETAKVLLQFASDNGYLEKIDLNFIAQLAKPEMRTLLQGYQRPATSDLSPKND